MRNDPYILKIIDSTDEKSVRPSERQRLIFVTTGYDSYELDF